VRRICFDLLKLKVDAHVPELGKTLGEELITPTRIYTETLQALMKDLPVHGLAHITGGGLVDNVVRVVPQGLGLLIRKGSWDVPPVFTFLRDAGRVPEIEMLRTFNTGIGMVAVVPKAAVSDVLDRLAGMNEKAFVIGEVVERRDGAERLVWG
jgi:phosphoribosylformylglycinamidine cyclo-ligase